MQALDTLQKEKPTLVLSDRRMPEMSGIELLQSLRKDGNRRPFGFITLGISGEATSLASGSGESFLLMEARPATGPSAARLFRRLAAGSSVRYGQGASDVSDRG